MANSMTGYGRCQQQVGGRDILVEFKSVNHRYFEFNARVPRAYGYLEERLKSLTQQQVSRGKVDCQVTLVATGDEGGVVRYNEALAQGYYEALCRMAAQLGLEERIGIMDVAQMPEVFTLEKRAPDEQEVWQAVQPVAQQALEQFVAMRAREGGRLAEDILGRLGRLEELLAFVEARSPQTSEEYRQRLLGKLQELLGDSGVDEQRLVTEAALFAERVAVDEETVRLRSHIAQYREILGQPGAAGRKLDFLTQELNREANTIGSKCQDVQMARAVVDMKAEIEKIREQVQNVE